MASHVSRGDTGVYTAEGNTAGDLAAALHKTRERQQQEYDRKRKEIEESKKRVSASHLNDKFTTHKSSADAIFRAKTVGLVTADEFRKAREEAHKLELNATASSDASKKVVKKRRMKHKTSKLSFDVDELEEETLENTEDSSTKATNETSVAGNKRKLGKDPTVRTDFLPDAEREKREQELREQLKKQWKEEQERIKKENVEITYSYWDGSGHRRTIMVPKGTSIGKFLEWVRQDLCDKFSELRMISSDNLLYIKEDLIIPHHYTFYDLILSEARGKSGPLFRFDVLEDIRTRIDARIERDESHPGKVVERRWYEQNKHIFPASRWEVYDPMVQREKYTVHGDEIYHKRR